MARINKRVQRQAFYGWIKWLPVLAAPFSVLFADAWLNTQTWKNDYEYERLHRRMRALCAELDAVRVDEARLERIDRLDEMATDLGLVPADSGQIEVVYYDAAPDTVRLPAPPIALARLDVQASETGAAAEAVAAEPVPAAAIGPVVTPVMLEIPDDVFEDAPSPDVSLSSLLGTL